MTKRPSENPADLDYEFFQDPSYYDMWAVRPVGETRWGHAFHVPSKDEAKGLAGELRLLDQIRAIAAQNTWDASDQMDAIDALLNTKHARPFDADVKATRQ